VTKLFVILRNLKAQYRVQKKALNTKSAEVVTGFLLHVAQMQIAAQ
jgi:hypothetical protein